MACPSGRLNTPATLRQPSTSTAKTEPKPVSSPPALAPRSTCYHPSDHIRWCRPGLVT